MVEELGLAAHVEFLGYLSAERMAHELAQSHIFVQPSFMENSSISLCEAMQVGMPCAAAYAGGMPSTVEHGRTGCLFPPGDAALLAQTVLELFRNGDRAQQLGRAARETASWRHSPERVISQLLAAYSSVAGVSVELRNAITSA
jgi:glycosyltransferase involved in cell wall biosynthesis